MIRCAFSLRVLGASVLISSWVSAGEEAAEVVVRGARTGSSHEEGATTVLEPAPEDAARPVADWVERAPGVAVSRAGSSADVTTVSIRGSSSNQVPVFVGGIRVQDEVLGVCDLSRLPPTDLERVEVVRGGSYQAGGGVGLAGALYLEPRMPRSTFGRMTTLGGSFGQFAWQGAAGIGRFGKNGVGAAALLAGRLDRGDGNFTYTDDAGTAFDPSDDRRRIRPNSDYQAGDVWGALRWVPTPGFQTQLLWNVFGREMGVSGLQAIPAEHARARAQRELLGVRLGGECGTSCFFSAFARGAAQQDFLQDPFLEMNLQAASLHTRAERGEAGVRVRYGLGDWTPSLDMRVERGELGIFSEWGRRVRAEEAALHAEASVRYAGPNSNWVIRGLGHVYDVTGVGTDGPMRVQALVPEASLGANLRVSPQAQLHSTVGWGARSPTLGERYGVSAAVRGRPDLRFENGGTADLGLRFHGSGKALTFGGDLTFFGRLAENLIIYERSALGYVRPQNLGTARILGGELAFTGKVWETLRAELALTVLDARDTTPGRMLSHDWVPYQSAWTARGALAAVAHPAGGPLGAAEIQWISHYRGQRFADAAGLLSLPEQWVQDVRVVLRFPAWRATFSASLENIFDIPRFDTIGYPLSGRAVQLSYDQSWGGS